MNHVNPTSYSGEKRCASFAGASLQGAAAGVVAGWAMTQFSKIWNRLSGSGSAPLGYSAQEWDATSRVAEFCFRRTAQRKCSRSELEAGAAAVHYLIAAAAGVGYGTAVRPRLPRSIWSGALMGAAMWLMGNEMLLPAMGIIRRRDYTLPMRANALGEHIVYGMTAALIFRQQGEAK